MLPDNSRYSDLIIAIVIVLCVSLAQTLLAFHWFDLKVFDQFNVLFDSDPNIWLRYWSSTTPDVGTSKHPLAAYYAGIPVLIVSGLIEQLAEVVDPASLRKTLALTAMPVATGLKQGLIFLTMRLLKLSRFEALIVTCLSVLSFSSVVFGSTPESYGFSGLLIVAGFFFVVLRYQSRHWASFVGLVVTSFLNIGASTANLLAAVLLLWADQTRHIGSSVRGLLTALGLAVVICIACLSTFWGLSEIRGVSLTPAEVYLPNTHDISTYRHEPSQNILNFVRFPERLAQSVIATLPATKENILLSDGDIYPFELSYNSQPFTGLSIPLYLAGLFTILFGTWSTLNATDIWRMVGTVSLGLIAVFAMVFSFYGNNTFLYSQHWQVATVMLLATNLRTGAFNRVKVLWVLCAICAVLAICLILVLFQIDLLFTTTCGDVCAG